MHITNNYVRITYYLRANFHVKNLALAVGSGV